MTRKAKVDPGPAAGPGPSMKKPSALGNKHACPKCATKFYDFEQEEGSCPKCGQRLNFKELHQAAMAKLAAPSKKAKAKPVEAEEAAEPVVTATAELESMDELDDGPETSLEELEVEEDEEEDY
jgi:uncharacterized protein (TIGR02300 family)